jgi:hypothetical protein
MSANIDSVRASLPSELELSRLRYARYLGKSTPEVAFLLACTWLPSSWRTLPLLGPAIGEWSNQQFRLKEGCLNPAVVLNAEDRLVAVFTNLTADGGRPTPVIKVIRERIHLATNVLTTGTRVAAAATYYSWKSGRWSDFKPVVVDCLVSRPDQAEAAKARLKPTAWDCLDAAVRMLGGNRPALGLYPVDLPDEMVSEAY